MKNGSTDSANRVANWAAAGVDCFSGGSEPTEWTASPAPAVKAAIAIAARYSTLLVMVPPSAPRTDRTLSEMVPERCLTLALERLLARRPGLHPRQSGRARRNGPRSIPRGKFPNASARRSNCFPFRPNGVTIRSQGTKAQVKTLEARDRRSPLTTRRMSRIAKGSLLQGPLFSKTSARADSQKRRSPIPFRIASCARNRESCGRGGCQCWCFHTRTRLLMLNRIDIDPKHSRAIVQEIGERLRAFLNEEPELPGNL